MTLMQFAFIPDVEERARRSQGTSSTAIYRMVARAVDGRHTGRGVLLDVGCGTGNLWTYLGHRFDHYLGADAVHYDGFPPEGEFCPVDLNEQHLPLADAAADVVAAVETIEHLENPRAFCRELVRLARPGGWVLVTTPNQLSLLSKMTLVVKNEFNAFQDSSYPAHLSALLEIDLRRMAAECRLTDIHVAYSEQGRMAFTPWHVPAGLSRFLPRAFSDNILLMGRKPTV
jgi:2-polyprenyl-3-methyl-5-hydroxy-6-metoxy-1,4-benzoquinol methylase